MSFLLFAPIVCFGGGAKEHMCACFRKLPCWSWTSNRVRLRRETRLSWLEDPRGECFAFAHAKRYHELSDTQNLCALQRHSSKCACKILPTESKKHKENNHHFPRMPSITFHSSVRIRHGFSLDICRCESCYVTFNYYNYMLCSKLVNATPFCQARGLWVHRLFNEVWGFSETSYVY